MRPWICCWLVAAMTAVLFGLELLGMGAGPAAAAPRLPSQADWPLPGPVVRGFEPSATAYGRGHRGVDLQGSPGQPVGSAAAGRVVFAGRIAGRGVVVVDHGSVRTTYEPVAASVRVGQRVELGQGLGTLQSGGHCRPACLHWGLRRGEEYLDPLSLVGSADRTGAVRLVDAARREVVEAAARRREVAARAAALAEATTAGVREGEPDVDVTGPAGSHGFLRPVAGGITSPFGIRFHPVLHRWKLHDGTDLGASCGTPVRAPYAGRVTAVHAAIGYGNRLFLEHGSVDGVRVTTAYNHASGYVARTGQTVRRGQVLGYVGATGFATGCHLHLMVWLDGRLTDPMRWW